MNTTVTTRQPYVAQNASNDRQWLAYHEAAHAVMAVELGFDDITASIEADEDMLAQIDEQESDEDGEMLIQSVYSSPAYENFVGERTLSELQQPRTWAAVDAVAEALEQQGALTSHEIGRIMSGSRIGVFQEGHHTERKPAEAAAEPGEGRQEATAEPRRAAAARQTSRRRAEHDRQRKRQQERQPQRQHQNSPYSTTE